MVVDEFHESELTKTAYCQKNEIPVSTLNYWENRLKEMKLAEEERGNRFVELSVPEGDSATIRFSSFNADDFVTEIALINGLKPYEYFKYLFEQLLESENNITDDFIDTLLPWSDKLPEELKNKT